MLLRDVMTADPITMRPSGTVGAAFLVMRKNGFRHVPILEGDALVGVISMTDIGREGATVPAILSKKIEEVMTKSVVTSPPDETVAVAAAKMASRKINCLPIVVEGKLIGIVTTFDLLDALAGNVESR